MLEESTRKRIEEIENTSRFPTGIGKIERGECPRNAWSAVMCGICPYGHALECHHPMTCEEAKCEHLEREM